MTTDEAILQGEQFARDHLQFARDHLRVIEAAYGEKAAMAYASGIASGVRNIVAERRLGNKAAWDLMDGLAQDLLDRQLVK